MNAKMKTLAMSKRSLFGAVLLATPLLSRTAEAQDRQVPDTSASATEPAVEPSTSEVEPSAAPSHTPPKNADADDAGAPLAPSVTQQGDASQSLTTASPAPNVSTNDAAEERTTREDPDAVFRAFNVYAQQERAYRITGAIGGVVLGGTTMGLGSVIADKTDTSNTPWLIVGGVTAGLSLLALVASGPGEQLAEEMRASESGHTAEEARMMEAKWEELADRAKTERIVGSIVGLVLGAGAVGTGVAFMAGAGDLSEDEEAVVGGLLIGSGAAIIVGSTANFFILKPEETSFAQYKASKAQSPSLQLSLGAAPSGFLLGASGTF